MKLSKNFTLDELTKSPSATRWGFEEQFTPPQDVIDNLVLLCTKVLQPIRDILKDTLTVSSGYRCPRLNAKIGGAYTIINGKPVQSSQHCYGQAADINYVKSGVEHNNLILAAIKELIADPDFKFDQCILEFGTTANPAWIHISYSNKKNRMQVLRAYKSGKKTLYKEWSL
jgi:zinc D-Ala-D-Ala carboxypeptidase